MSLYVAFTKTSRLGCWLQWNAATECNVMLPLSVQKIIHVEGVPRLRFDQDDIRFALRRVRCGLPTNRPERWIG